MRKVSCSAPDWCFSDHVSDESDFSKVPNGTRVALRCLTDVVTARLEWVWEGVIPRGTLTLITDEPGVGKSRFMLGVIAAMTRGLRGPDDRPRIDANKEPLTLALSPDDRGEGIGSPLRANDYPLNSAGKRAGADANVAKLVELAARSGVAIVVVSITCPRCQRCREVTGI